MILSITCMCILCIVPGAVLSKRHSLPNSKCASTHNRYRSSDHAHRKMAIIEYYIPTFRARAISFVTAVLSASRSQSPAIPNRSIQLLSMAYRWTMFLCIEREHSKGSQRWARVHSHHRTVAIAYIFGEKIMCNVNEVEIFFVAFSVFSYLSLFCCC